MSNGVCGVDADWRVRTPNADIRYDDQGDPIWVAVRTALYRGESNPAECSLVFGVADGTASFEGFRDVEEVTPMQFMVLRAAQAYVAELDPIETVEDPEETLQQYIESGASTQFE